MESLFPGVYLIEGEVRGRPIRLPLLVGRAGALLIDTGTRAIAEERVLPALEAVAGGPRRLRWILVTHSDREHLGGNAVLKRAAPEAILACGTADREHVEDPDRLLGERYDAYRGDHGVAVPDERRAQIRESCGDPQDVDLTLSGGERIRFDAGWDLEVLPLPGHSRGHIGILDRRHHVLYAGDALHGAFYPGPDGAPKMPPTYLEVDRYLDTTRTVLALARGAACTSYIGCHWPVKRGLEEISSFCEESRRFCLHAEQLVLSEVRSGEPVALGALIGRLGPRLGDWPRSEDIQLRFALAGHLDLLERRNLIHSERQGTGKVYRG